MPRLINSPSSPLQRPGGLPARESGELRQRCFARQTSPGVAYTPFLRRPATWLALPLGQRTAPPFAQAFEQQPNAHARRAAGLVGPGLFRVRRACDIEMHPGRLADETPQECGSGEGTSVATAGVLEIRDVAADVFSMLLPERHGPDALRGRFAGLAQPLHQAWVVS